MTLKNRIEKTDPVFYSEAEKESAELLVAGAFSSSDVIIQSGIAAEDIYDPTLRTIWEAACSLCASREPIDVIRVSGITGCPPEALRQFIDSTGPRSINPSSAGKIIRNGSISRQLYKAGLSIKSRLAESTDSEQILENVISDIIKIRRGCDKGNDARSIARDRIAHLIDLRQRKEAGEKIRLGIPTGLTALDVYLGGLGRGHVTIGGARPKIGKSSFALQAAIGACDSGEGVHYFPLEDRNENTIDRYISRVTGISSQLLRTLRFDVKDIGRIQRAEETIPKNLILDDSSGLTAKEIARRVAAKCETNKTGLAVVDYLQLLNKENVYQDPNTMLMDAMGVFKDSAKDLGISYLVLSQLNRKLEERGQEILMKTGEYTGYYPEMADFKWSGSLEEVAKCILLFHREAAYNDGVSDDTFLIQVAAYNFGQAGKWFPFEWDGPCTRIVNKVKTGK